MKNFLLSYAFEQIKIKYELMATSAAGGLGPRKRLEKRYEKCTFLKWISPTRGAVANCCISFENNMCQLRTEIE